MAKITAKLLRVGDPTEFGVVTRIYDQRGDSPTTLVLDVKSDLGAESQLVQLNSEVEVELLPPTARKVRAKDVKPGMRIDLAGFHSSLEVRVVAEIPYEGPLDRADPTYLIAGYRNSAQHWIHARANREFTLA